MTVQPDLAEDRAAPAPPVTPPAKPQSTADQVKRAAMARRLLAGGTPLITK